MICEICYGMLRGHKGRRWRRTYELHFDHQASGTAIRASAIAGCCFCKVLAEVLESQGCSAREIDPLANTQAFLSEVPRRQGLYRLDFRLGDSSPLATFFLEQLHDGPDAQVYTPSTENTNSQEALQLARSWITTCAGPEHSGCPNESFERFKGDSTRYYPTRLIKLPPYHSKPYEADDIKKIKVELVHTNGQSNQPPQPDMMNGNGTPQSPNGSSSEVQPDAFGPWQYVTLSHCWGTCPFYKLEIDNLKDFEKGVPLAELPKSFQEAIDFASRLRKDVRYIWIDALCIIQDSDEDWKKESVKMYDVYRNSFCNISATHACDNSEGLYRKRDPQHLWEDEIRLNTEGIPTPFPQKSRLGAEPLLRRCGILDATSWARTIEDASVNVRAWVLQERLLAPRVLHFGRHQIAWECCHLKATESLPYGTSDLQVQGGIVLEKTSLKSSLPREYGPRSLVPDSEHLAWQAHECWKRIIERYSTTSITKESDRLIALAGIAQMISRQIGKRVWYVAGLWEKWLASQLLWRVNSAYADGTYSFPQRRARNYIAPTFSWASILAKQGVRCGETVNEDRLLFSVKDINIPQKKEEDRFSVIAGDEAAIYVELSGKLAPINLVRGKGCSTNRYRWNLANGDYNPRRDLSGLHLDSPEDDAAFFGAAQPGLYCMPAYSNSKDYTICLILRLVNHKESPSHYKRVGLAMVPAYEATQLAPERAKTVGPSSSDGVKGGWHNVHLRLY